MVARPAEGGERERVVLWCRVTLLPRRGVRAEEAGLEQAQERSRRNLTTALGVTSQQGHHLQALGAELAKLLNRVWSGGNLDVDSPERL